MKVGKTDINILLDGSWSMKDSVQSVEEAINGYIDSQRNQGECFITVAQFDGDPYAGRIAGSETLRYSKCWEARDIDTIPSSGLPTGWYKAEGNTPLLAALKRLINDTGDRLAALPEEERPEKVIIVCQTDGEENASAGLATKDEVRNLIEQQEQGYKWEFVFMGADFDAFGEGAGYGFTVANVLQYKKNDVGIKHAYASLGANTSAVRCRQVSSMAFSAEQQKVQDNLGARSSSDPILISSDTDNPVSADTGK